MNKRVDIKVYRNNRFINNDFVIVKYEGHFEILKSIYEKQGYTIEVVK